MIRNFVQGLGAAVALTALASTPALAGPIVVTTTTDATALVNNLLAGATGITLVGTPTLISSSTSAGTFTGATGIIPFDGGVILTSGDANFAEENNTADNRTGVVGTPGDPALTALAGNATTDSTILEFQFTADDPVISFQYVFASEEYNEFVGSQFNDVFAFFLNGVNIALIPGTLSPVTINNVNCGSNAQYYTNNDASTPGGGGDATCVGAGQPNAGLAVQYDGLVGASVNPLFWLFASGNVLTGGATNTIRLAIADTSDSSLDSAVFLKAGSFINQPPPATVPEPATLTLLGVGLAAAAARRRLRSRRK